MTPRRIWARRVGHRLLFAAFLGVTALAVLEILVRVFAPQQEPSLWLEPDARYGHVMKTNFHQQYHFLGSDFVMDVRTNAQGLRDDDIEPHSDSVKTILFLGDSFTFGHGVNVADRFDKRLAALCRDRRAHV